MIKKRFRVKELEGVWCAVKVDDTLENLVGVKSATTSYLRQIVDVEYDEIKVTEAQIMAAVQTAAFTVSDLTPQ